MVIISSWGGFFLRGGGVEERGEEINIEWSELEKWKKGGERKKERKKVRRTGKKERNGKMWNYIKRETRKQKKI